MSPACRPGTPRNGRIEFWEVSSLLGAVVLVRAPPRSASSSFQATNITIDCVRAASLMSKEYSVPVPTVYTSALPGKAAEGKGDT